MAGQAGGGERLTRLTLKLGGEQFDLVGLSASEGLSQPFHIVIDVISKLGSFDLLPHLGKPAMVESLADGSHMRYFHGIVTDGQLVGEVATGVGRQAAGEYLYRMTIRPKAYFHDLGRDNRIFQDKSVRDIIKDVLGRCHIDFDEKLRGAGASRTLKYCVQFGESDMSFISRLMEEHGIYYFYRHEAGKHVMVLCDDPGAHTQVDCGHLAYNAMSGSIGNSHSRTRGDQTQSVTDWQEFLSTGAEAKTTFRDYDFTRPKLKVEGVVSGASQHEADAIEIYEWPGRFYDLGEGQNLAGVMLEARRAQRASYQGSTGCTEMVPGFTFNLTKHPNARFNKSFLIIGVHTMLANETYASGDGGARTEVRFTAIRADTKFRAPLVTPRPIARGPETAVVVGPPNEEIYVDKYGRIKVQFHWDRLGKMNDQSSCWIRVSQTGGLGNIIIPRIGHEVLVDFINGDPDRPIVVGRVFNEQAMPVYALPANKTRAVWRSKTYQRTTGSDLPDSKTDLITEKPAANEIRFEDKTGSEELYVHAEKDMNTVVRYCDTLKVGKDQTVEIGKDQKITVYKDRTEEVQGFEKVTIFKDRTEEVQQNENITVKMNRTETVMADESITIKGKRDTKISGDDIKKIDGDLKIDVTGEIDITANKKIVLSCGGSKIEITPSEITISTVQFSASAMANAKVAGNAQLELSGGVLASLTAAMVKIN